MKLFYHQRHIQRGFTIVELLIVIVVIAILAAITVVAYNGIQARGKTSAAQSTASNIVKKAQLYNTEVGYYPIGISAMSSAPATASYNLTGVVVQSLTNDSPTNASASLICGSGSPASANEITANNVVGGWIYYRDYQNSTNLRTSYGIVSGTGIVCYWIN